MKILADENIPLSVVKFLKKRGHDVATLYELGKGGASNSEVIEIARKAGRAILTLDLDFGRVYYFASKKIVNIMVVRVREPTPDNMTKLLDKFLKLHPEPRGLAIISEKKIRFLR